MHLTSETHRGMQEFVRARRSQPEVGAMAEESQQQHAQNGGAQHIAHNRKHNQLSSFVLFLSVVILVNLCPFDSETNWFAAKFAHTNLMTANQKQTSDDASTQLNNFMRPPPGYVPGQFASSFVEVVRLVFTQPVRLSRRTTYSTFAEAKVLGKMAKMWYIKKKIKKLSKKLKKHTIAVPVFTAIPIYEHSYYPQPHVTHVSHGGLHHAASSYASAVAPVAAASAAAGAQMPAVGAGSGAGQQMATAASSQHQLLAPYRQHAGSPHAGIAHAHGPHSQPPGAPGAPHPHPALFHPMGPAPAASAHQIINSYAPSPPLFVDDAGGLYGQYGNAYGRYDGGYHMW